ncbi:hypothetical protein [Paenibacillus graminis]|uniref:hypothetical protein n=1 Tax=Paenibacillus graminis TaxID=189425 RepID=UPI002DB8CE23|nr:hypothetical protein [Paenibacillus graminis]MEC0167409.1 hypothetical protein [Paenibacillus graminis]
MQRYEVVALIREIWEAYDYFDTSDKNIDYHHERLEDFSFEAAMKNVKQHILTNPYPPKISHIRGTAGSTAMQSQTDSHASQVSKESAEAYFQQLDGFSAGAIKPPEAVRRTICELQSQPRDTHGA